MKQLRVGTKDFEIDEGLTFVSIREAIKAPQPENALGTIGWEIVYPNLLGTGLASTNPVAVLDARRGQSRLSQIMVAWDNHMTTYQISFTTRDDYLSIRFLDLRTPVIPVVMETPTTTYAFTVDQVTNAISGESPQTLAPILDPIRRDFKELREPLQAWITSLDADRQANTTVVAREAAKEKCDSDRKTGWTIAVGGAILAGIAIVSAPVSLSVAVVGMAAAGATGGAQAAKTDNDYKECKEKAGKPPA